MGVGSTMSFFFKRKQKLRLNDEGKQYKTVYLGNIQISLVKGEGCLKKPLDCIWNHYEKTGCQASTMTISVTNKGLIGNTEEQGEIVYKAHRITYFQCPMEFDRIFAWVYRHESKKMKYECRCHAVLLPKQQDAWDLSAELKERMLFAFREFVKVKRQRARLYALQQGIFDEKASAIPQVPKRRIQLSPGFQYKPPVTDARHKLSTVLEDNANEGKAMREMAIEEEEEAEVEDDVISEGGESSQNTNETSSLSDEFAYTDFESSSTSSSSTQKTKAPKQNGHAALTTDDAETTTEVIEFDYKILPL